MSLIDEASVKVRKGSRYMDTHPAGMLTVPEAASRADLFSVRDHTLHDNGGSGRTVGKPFQAGSAGRYVYAYHAVRAGRAPGLPGEPTPHHHAS